MDLEGALTRRREAIFDRLEQLDQRETQLANRLTRALPPESLADATAHAAAASDRATAALVHAAQTHEVAADLHQRFATMCDAYGATDRAFDHRRAAEQEWTAASNDRRTAADGRSRSTPPVPQPPDSSTGRLRPA
ncbi:hypothetical protein LWC33_22590 [Pseudonocardia sp. RS11V-5]|uniref:hypothetical protein n=1 Tax=Pseudonocardia terrae TaxID=2905831 RepID=UPI001E58C197|nr:hypothetical protein [Pseudonocardia terrae]MCE3554228.1 hypothetical protein [Pseudonocardia terrae]